MKRVPYYYLQDAYIKKIWPIFFWRHCEICKKEFRREYGWKVFMWSHYMSDPTYHYICRDCCDLSSVIEYRKKERALKENPPEPPPTVNVPEQMIITDIKILVDCYDDVKELDVQDIRSILDYLEYLGGGIPESLDTKEKLNEDYEDFMLK